MWQTQLQHPTPSTTSSSRKHPCHPPSSEPHRTSQSNSIRSPTSSQVDPMCIYFSQQNMVNGSIEAPHSIQPTVPVYWRQTIMLVLMYSMHAHSSRRGCWRWQWTQAHPTISTLSHWKVYTPHRNCQRASTINIDLSYSWWMGPNPMLIISPSPIILITSPLSPTQIWSTWAGNTIALWPQTHSSPSLINPTKHSSSIWATTPMLSNLDSPSTPSTSKSNYNWPSPAIYQPNSSL